jgi:hypothetical protein
MLNNFPSETRGRAALDAMAIILAEVESRLDTMAK